MKRKRKETKQSWGGAGWGILGAIFISSATYNSGYSSQLSFVVGLIMFWGILISKDIYYYHNILMEGMEKLKTKK